MDDLKNFIGAKIRERRLQLDMNQADLAGLMKCEPPLISRYERGVTMPTIEQLIKISDALDIAVTQLLPAPRDPEKIKAAYLRQVISTKILDINSSATLEKIVLFIDAFGEGKKDSFI